MIEDEIKQKKFKDNYQKAVINIMFTSGCLKRRVQAVLKPFGITHTQYNVLRILNGASPNPCSPGEIGNVMIEKMADVTRLLDRLKAKGLVEREVCEKNRRKLDVYITEEGKKLLQDIDPNIEKHHQEFHSKISSEEAELLSDLLDKFRG